MKVLSPLPTSNVQEESFVIKMREALQNHFWSHQVLRQVVQQLQRLLHELWCCEIHHDQRQVRNTHRHKGWLESGIVLYKSLLHLKTSWLLGHGFGQLLICNPQDQFYLLDGRSDVCEVHSDAEKMAGSTSAA
jgi:hypothetical protein